MLRLAVSNVKGVTITQPDAESSPRTSGGILGGFAGLVIGAGAGIVLGGASGGGSMNFAPFFTALVAAPIGACVGVFVGRYIADKSSLKAVHFDPAIPSRRDSLRIYAECSE